MQRLPAQFSDLTLDTPRARRSRSAASPPLLEAVPPSVVAPGPAPAASGQTSLPLPPAPVQLAAMGQPAGPSFPGLLEPSWPSLVTPLYSTHGDVTTIYDWVRQHLPIVVDVVVTNDCLALWPDICAELSPKP
jgi:hypothetical protein